MLKYVRNVDVPRSGRLPWMKFVLEGWIATGALFESVFQTAPTSLQTSFGCIEAAITAIRILLSLQARSRYGSSFANRTRGHFG